MSLADEKTLDGAEPGRTAASPATSQTTLTTGEVTALAERSSGFLPDTQAPPGVMDEEEENAEENAPPTRRDTPRED